MGEGEGLIERGRGRGRITDKFQPPDCGPIREVVLLERGGLLELYNY